MNLSAIGVVGSSPAAHNEAATKADTGQALSRAPATSPTAKVAAIEPKTDEATQPSTLDQLKRAAEDLTKFVQPYASELQFTVDEQTGIDVVKVVDTSTQQVIRQIPSEEIVAIAASIEKLQGLLLRQKA